jgi:integrase
MMTDERAIGASAVGYLGIIIRAAYKENAAMKSRQTFQHGWIVRKSRSKGPDVWVLRWREGEADKSRTLGTMQQLRTKAEAQRAASKVTAEINNSVDIATFGQLARRYLQEAIPERHSTSGPVRSMLNARILPEWEDVRVVDMAKNPIAVEQWIKGLQAKPKKKGEKPHDLAPKSKLHTKGGHAPSF